MAKSPKIKKKVVVQSSWPKQPRKNYCQVWKVKSVFHKDVYRENMVYHSQQYIGFGREIMFLNANVRGRASRYTAKQLEKISKCFRKLRLKHFKNVTFIVMDDDKYFTFSNQYLDGNDHFHTDDISKTPLNVKFGSTNWQDSAKTERSWHFGRPCHDEDHPAKTPKNLR